MPLPFQQNLPVNLLAACFNKTSATYKHYWFLSILQAVETGNFTIAKRDLFAGMIANAWYTINYFHVSFGKQDKLQRAIEAIKITEAITIDEKKDRIMSILTHTSKRESISHLDYFNTQVPHWFLSPWFPRNQEETDSQQKSRIYTESKLPESNSLYALYEDEIVINPEWRDYLTTNIRLLKDFCYWNLVMYLQAKNPNVPDIPNKLIKPAVRASLTKQRREYWDIVFNELGTINCIYTGKELIKEDYAVEHFIPYNFVSHDLIWNLIPADKSFNSTKSDKLPSLEKYFNPFFDLQQTAIQIVKDKNPKNKLLEDYLTIFSDLDGLSGLSNQFTKERFRERIQPLITIAANNGFEFLI